MLHPLAGITSAYRVNLGWDTLTGGLLTRMFPGIAPPCIRIVVISPACLAILSYLLWYVLFTLGLWPWLVLYVKPSTSVFYSPCILSYNHCSQLYQRLRIQCIYLLQWMYRGQLTYSDPSRPELSMSLIARWLHDRHWFHWSNWLLHDSVLRTTTMLHSSVMTASRCCDTTPPH